MSPSSTSSVASTADGSTSRQPSAMLDHYLDSSLEAFQRLSLEPPSSSSKKGKKKEAKKKTKKYLKEWEKSFEKAAKSEST